MESSSILSQLTRTVENVTARLTSRKLDEEQCHNYCFLCATSLQESTPFPTDDHIAQQISLCKTFLEEIELSPLSGKNYANTENNNQSCPTCRQEMQKVWNLHMAMVAIKEQITDILTRSMQKGKDRKKIRLQTNEAILAENTFRETPSETGNLNFTEDSNFPNEDADHDDDNTGPWIKVEDESVDLDIDAEITPDPLSFSTREELLPPRDKNEGLVDNNKSQRMWGNGRPWDPVWDEFTTIQNTRGMKKSKCIHCTTLVSHRADRMKKHINSCQAYQKYVLGQPL
ncbi:uncharacterized protein LOC110861602 [Folsomia candida]|uniref:BED-type domain-containing protein n=1 Tax=Folsomia candida TaxID=158441 RepID=A0A226D294_FOLCA|nr:uncharacterized protein LOC110861602 [Folsomia candida]OXA38847.1 hypothetical protein Fcan01_26366 [Folsomia candida]